jgi:hypothetical protein
MQKLVWTTNLNSGAPWSPFVFAAAAAAPSDSRESDGRCLWIVPRRPPFSVAEPRRLLEEDDGCRWSSGSSSLMAILTATAAAGDMVLLSRCSQGADKALLASPGITAFVSSSSSSWWMLWWDAGRLGDGDAVVAPIAPAPWRMVVKPVCLLLPCSFGRSALMAASGLCCSKCDGGSVRFVAPVVMLVTTPFTQSVQTLFPRVTEGRSCC